MMDAAEVISTQLQSLLNIPPIRKTLAGTELVSQPPDIEPGNPMPSTNGTESYHGIRTQASHRVVYDQKTGIDTTYQPRGASRREHNRGSERRNDKTLFPGQAPRVGNYYDAVAPIQINSGLNSSGNKPRGSGMTHTQQFNERTPPNVSCPKDMERRNVYLNESQTNRSKSKIVSHVMELLRSQHCPRNIVALRDRIIEAAQDENKPTYYLYPDKLVFEVFKLHHIEPLAKKSAKFVRAKYFCKICNYHMDNVANVLSHVSNLRHTSNAKLRNLEQDLHNIPFPAANHALNLHFLMESIMNRYGIDDSERSLRYGVLEKLNRRLAFHKIQLELFGSSVSGFGFKTSDINMNLDLTQLKCEGSNDQLSSTEHGLVVYELAKILETFDFVRDVTEGVHVLQIKFTDCDVDRNCLVHVNNVSGMQLAQLFLEYDKLDSRVRPIVVAFRHWARTTEIDDQQMGFLPGHAYTIMALKHLLDVRVIPYIIDPDNSVNFRSFIQAKETPQTWKSPNAHNLGCLWLGLLRKYSIEFCSKEFVVSLVQPFLAKSEDKVWNRKLSIEDPIIPRSNLGRSASTSRVFDYVVERIKYTFKYFGYPRTHGVIPHYDKIVPLRTVKQPYQVSIFFGSKQVQEPVTAMSLTSSTVTEQLSHGLLNHEREACPRVRFIKMEDYNGDIKVCVVEEDLGLLDNILSPMKYHYEFAREIFQEGEKPPEHCKSCGTDGHTRRNCPEEQVPPLVPVPRPDNFTIQLLDSVMLRVCAEKGLSDHDTEERLCLLDDIYRCLVGQFPDIELTLFGSTNNGFGLRGSDVDVCVRFKDHPIRKADFRSEEVANILKGIVDRLRGSGCMLDVIGIPSAKVPIVKFKHKKTQLEGDISLSNALALRNTLLLRAYADIDPRVKILGCFIKQLTKLCDITDASKGSLSSYGYVLMLIHFLQQHRPPVLPVLQQLYSENHEENIVDGWDSYFYSQVDPVNLAKHWSGFRSNQESVADLFLGFIKYYTETFNYEEHVVTISQLEPLLRKEKRWTTSTLICVEDPFEKSHNLGAGLTKRMSVFVIKTFQRYRQVFSRSITNYSPLIDYMLVFLDPKVIRGEMHPPVDRQCRICNRIGHFASTCNYASNTESNPEENSPAKVECQEPNQELVEEDPHQMDIRRLN